MDQKKKASNSSRNGDSDWKLDGEPPKKNKILHNSLKTRIVESRMDDNIQTMKATNGLANWEQTEASSLSRYPPDMMIPFAELNPLFVCYLCGCYIYNATTVVECMHTYCRKCIYIHIERSKKCPSCNALLDESNPISSLRDDKIYQEIINKIFPEFAKEDKEQEEKFYKERGKDVPSKVHTPNGKKKMLKPQKVKRWISLRLEFLGYNKEEVPPVNELKKNLVVLPLQTTVKHIQKYLAVKLPLTDYFQALIFHKDHLLHENLTMEELVLLFWPEIDVSLSGIITKSPIKIQYGIVPKGRDYFFLLSMSNTETEQEEQPKNKTKRSTPSRKTSVDSSNSNMESELYEGENSKDSCGGDQNFESNNNVEKPYFTCSYCEGVTSNISFHIQAFHENLTFEQKSEIKKNSFEYEEFPSLTHGKICSICHRVQINISRHYSLVHKHLTDEEHKEASERNVNVFVQSVNEHSKPSKQPRYCCKCNMLQKDVEKHVREAHKSSVEKYGLSSIVKKCPYVFAKGDKGCIETLLEYIH